MNKLLIHCYNNPMEDFFEELKKNERLCMRCGKCNFNLPQSPWGKVPENCGFEGWLFQMRESEKQKVRKLKEQLLSLQVSLKKNQGTNSFKNKEIIEKIAKIKNKIDECSQYGSADW